MERWNGILGIASVVLITAGAVIYGVFFSTGWPAVLPLVSGLVLSVIVLAGNYRRSRLEGHRRSAREGVNAVISLLVVAGIVVFLQTISSRHGIRIDTTSNKRFSLSPQTVKVLGSLSGNVALTCFFKDASQERMEVQDLLSEYIKASPKITFRLIDPDKDPLTAKRYDLKTYGSIFVEMADRREQASGIKEKDITNAINRVMLARIQKICFSTGHGEKSIMDGESGGFASFADALRSENFEVTEIVSLGSGLVPGECDLLVVAGPDRDILKIEQNMILDYLSKGGKALFLLDPAVRIPNIAGIALAFGMKVGDDMVIDKFGKMIAGNYLTPVVNKYSDHPITKDFRLYTYFPQARSVWAYKKLPDGLSVTVLGETDGTAYAETGVDTLLITGKTQYEGEKDYSGPVPIAAVGEIMLPSGRADSTIASPSVSRLAVFGDSDFATNANLRISGNRDFILNAVTWLAEQENMVAVRPVENLNQPVLLSTEQGRFVFWIPVIGFPSAIAIIGVIILFLKKRSE